MAMTGEQAKRVRERELKWTQMRLGSYLGGVAQSTISKWENMDEIDKVIELAYRMLVVMKKEGKLA